MKLPSVRKGSRPGAPGYGRRSIEASLREGGIENRDGHTDERKRERSGCPGAGRRGDGGPDGLFPFPTIREGQRQFMEDVRVSIRDGKVLLAEAPTGIGKTAAALTPAVEWALKNGGMALFLTSKQSQHRIAVDTARRIGCSAGDSLRVVDVISKQDMCPRDLSHLPNYAFNFMCRQQQKEGTCPYFRQAGGALLDEIHSEVMDVEELTERAVQRRVCPHRAALEAARGAHLLICDYNYLFSDLKEPVLSSLSRELDELTLIVDEAHNLPDRIRANQGEELSLNVIQEALRSLSGRPALRENLSMLRDLFMSRGKKALENEEEAEVDKREFVSEIRGVFHRQLDASMDAERFIEELTKEGAGTGTPDEENPIVRVSDFLDGLLRLKDHHLLYFAGREGRTDGSIRLIYRSLDPGEVSGSIFKGCHSAVLMSGTLRPPSMFGDILGISKAGRIERSYPSPFPSRNRLVLIDTRHTTAFRRRSNSMYKGIADGIAGLSSFVPGNVAAFFPSYFLMESVCENMPRNRKRLLVERRDMDKRDKERLISDLVLSRRSGGGLLMAVMGGSLSEGVDYRDNLLSAVFVVGLPLAPPTLEVKALRDHFRRKFGPAKGDAYSYDYPAVNRILQAAGRSIRSETDRAVIVLMERRLREGRYARFLPEDMTPSELGVEAGIRSFFE